MPRVLRILNRFNLGGPTYNAAYLSKFLSPDFETMLIGGPNEVTEENSEFIVRSLGIEPLIIPEMKRPISPKDDIIAYNKIKDIISQFKPDIVHTHAAKAGALGRMAASSMKVPIIIHTYHGHVFDAYFNSFKSSLFRAIERRLATNSTKIIAISKIQKQDLAKKYKICKVGKISVIPLGFDLLKFNENKELKRKIFREKYRIDEDEIAIGIIGRLVPIKNHALFLEAIKYVHEHSTQKIRAFIIGDGEEKNNLTSKAQELGLDYIHADVSNDKAILTFTSWITDIDNVTAAMDIIAMTSLNEGTPVSLIEAQAAGTPIVTTNVGGISDVVIPDKTALLSEIHDSKKFSENLLKLVESVEMRKSMSALGWEHVKDKYHYTRLIRDMKKLYLSLLEKSGKSKN